MSSPMLLSFSCPSLWTPPFSFTTIPTVRPVCRQSTSPVYTPLELWSWIGDARSPSFLGALLPISHLMGVFRLTSGPGLTNSFARPFISFVFCPRLSIFSLHGSLVEICLTHKRPPREGDQLFPDIPRLPPPEGHWSPLSDTSNKNLVFILTLELRYLLFKCHAYNSMPFPWLRFNWYSYFPVPYFFDRDPGALWLRAGLPWTT